MDRAWSGRLERAGCVEQEERHDLRPAPAYLECVMRTDAEGTSAPCWLDGAKMPATRKQARPRRGSSPAARRWCRPAAYAALLAVACVGLAALAGAALEHAGLRLVESDRARAVRLLTWASQLSALGPAAAGRLVHRAPLVGPRLAGACWSGLQPESSYALGHAMLQVAASSRSCYIQREHQYHLSSRCWAQAHQ